MSWFGRLGAAVVVLTFAFGCKDSSGPSVNFPELPTQLLADYCVVGERTVGQGISSTLSNTDCEYGDGSFFEVWRVRVTSSGSYRFAATSTFDNLLAVLRLDSFTTTTAYLTLLANDDDSGTDANALISGVSLAPSTDYFVVVNGYGATDTGPYTVSFTRP